MSNISDLILQTKRQIHIVTSAVAYAIASIEADASPKFQLGTVIRMGLSDSEVNDPTVIAFMRWEYKAWMIGHAFADISECLATLLNSLVKIDGKALGYKQQLDKFERLGLELKIKALTKISIAEHHVAAIDAFNRARNCLTHRHGVVGTRDCNDGDTLVMKWFGIKVSDVTNEETEFNPSYRGPAGHTDGQIIALQGTIIERRYELNSRLNIEPYDLCTIAFCLNEITEAIEKEAERLLNAPKTPQECKGTSANPC